MAALSNLSMKEGLRSLLVICSCIFVLACALPLRIAFLNNSGTEIAIRVSTSTHDVFKYVEIGDRRRWTAPIGHVAGVEQQIRLSRNGCIYVYQVPEGPFPYAPDYSDPYLTVQVEPDLTLNVRPDGRGIFDRADIARMQSEGFPLRPISKTCG
jgi:hypothetical protein